MLKSHGREQSPAYWNSLGQEGWEVVTLDFHALSSGLSFRGVARRPVA